MEMNKPLISVQNLRTSFFTDSGEVCAVNGVSFNLDHGEILGIVGESGSGKSVTAYSIMQILANTGKIVGGDIYYKGENITQWNDKQMRKFRGKCCSIIFQDPMTSLNPVFTIGNQLTEAITLHTEKKGKAAKERAAELLTLVGINEPERRLKQYPYELSGGMRQRVMIAMALACEPDILIADEPTTALDVTIQAQILELIQNLQKELGMAVILVTHDLGVIASMCDNIVVMYGGRISLIVSFLSVFLVTIFGIILGGIAGYYGGAVDTVIMRICDVLMCLPTLPLMLIIGTVLDANGVKSEYYIYLLMGILSLFSWTGMARLVRGQILYLREQEYMVAAEAMGYSTARRIFKHLIPNILPQILVSMTMSLGSMILYESTLSYLGLGVQIPYASWGTMIEIISKRSDILKYNFNVWAPSGFCIIIAVLAFNFIGDGLRDALDPKQRR